MGIAMASQRSQGMKAAIPTASSACRNDTDKKFHFNKGTVRHKLPAQLQMHRVLPPRRLGVCWRVCGVWDRRRNQQSLDQHLQHRRELSAFSSSIKSNIKEKAYEIRMMYAEQSWSLLLFYSSPGSGSNHGIVLERIALAVRPSDCRSAPQPGYIWRMADDCILHWFSISLSPRHLTWIFANLLDMINSALSWSWVE